MINVSTKFCGIKEIPSNITASCYHPIQNLLCIGTEDGKILALGSDIEFYNYNFLKKNGINEKEVTKSNCTINFIVPILSNYLVTINSSYIIKLFSLPHLDLLDSIDSFCLFLEKNEEITYVYNDINKESHFLYIGTSTSKIKIFDLTLGLLKYCNYDIIPADLQLSSIFPYDSLDFIVCSIACKPNDEKYLAIGLVEKKKFQIKYLQNNSIKSEEDDERKGVVIIYNLVRRRVSKVYKVFEISSLQWIPSSDLLFAGCSNGKIIAINVDKRYSKFFWSYCDSSKTFSDNEIINSIPPKVEKILWLNSQFKNETMNGFLVVLLTSQFQENNYNSKIILIKINRKKLLSHENNLNEKNNSYWMDFGIAGDIEFTEILNTSNSLKLHRIDNIQLIPMCEDQWDAKNQRLIPIIKSKVFTVPGILLHCFSPIDEDEVRYDEQRFLRDKKIQIVYRKEYSFVQSLYCPLRSLNDWELNKDFLHHPYPISNFNGTLQGSFLTSCFPLNGTKSNNHLLSLVKCLMSSKINPPGNNRQSIRRSKLIRFDLRNKLKNEFIIQEDYLRYKPFLSKGFLIKNNLYNSCHGSMQTTNDFSEELASSNIISFGFSDG